MKISKAQADRAFLMRHLGGADPHVTLHLQLGDNRRQIIELRAADWQQLISGDVVGPLELTFVTPLPTANPVTPPVSILNP